MPMSSYYADLRRRLGPDLLMMPAVAAVVHDGAARILIQERAEGGFSLPAGAIEPGETPEMAVVREVREKTGLIVQPVALLGVFGGTAYRVIYPNGDRAEYLVCLFRCAIVGGSLAAMDGESRQLHFLAPGDVPALGTEYPRHLFVPA